MNSTSSTVAWYSQSSCCDRNRRADISAKVHPPMKNTIISFGGSELESSLVIEFPGINFHYISERNIFLQMRILYSITDEA